MVVHGTYNFFLTVSRTSFALILAAASWIVILKVYNSFRQYSVYRDFSPGENAIAIPLLVQSTCLSAITAYNNTVLL